MTPRILTVAFLTMAASGCGSPNSTPPAPAVAVAPIQKPAKGLTAVVSPGPKPNTIAVEYQNNTPNEVAVNDQVLGSNILALEVRDLTGEIRLTVPPPVPALREVSKIIPPGTVHREEYTLHMFSPPLPPGRYKVAVRIEGWSCEPLEYDVTAEGE